MNKQADNGNTALHAAVNNEHIECVLALLNIQTLDVNAVNTKCENSTALHLAVMHGMYQYMCVN